MDFFTEAILGFKNNWHHKDWYKILENKNYRKIVLAAPRSHSKSTSFAVNYPLWELTRNRNIRIVIVSNTAEQAASFLREIKGHLERGEKYRQVYGNVIPMYPDKWTNREIIVDRSNNKLKDPSISTVGMGGAILSRRADLIVCDDILKPELLRTKEGRDKIKEWFFEVLLPVLEPKGRLVFIGTVWHPEDLLVQLLNDSSYNFRKKYKAIISDSERLDLWDKYAEIIDEKSYDPDLAYKESEEFLKQNSDELYRGVEVLWKERIDYKQLFLLRKNNSIAFEKMYQNEITSREGQLFKEVWLDKAKEAGKNYRLLYNLPKQPEGQSLIVTGGMDLAISQESWADDSVVVTVGRFPDGKKIPLNIERGKWTPAETRKNVVQEYQRFNHVKIKVESVAYQDSMRRDLAEFTNLPIEGYKTGGEKFNEYVGVTSLAVEFENGKWILPYDKTDPRTIRLIDQLVDEMRRFPDGHTGDGLMALWFANTAQREVTSGSGFYIMAKEALENAGGKSSEQISQEQLIENLKRGIIM